MNTNSGKKLYICVTPQPNNINQAAMEALAWVQVSGVGEVGEMGVSTNVTSFDTWDNDTVLKGKGMSDAGSPTVEVARNATDAGQIALRAAALTNYNYAFKIEGNDAPAAGWTNTILYNRGLVMGPTRPMGRNEDFDLEVFTLGLQQKEIVVNPVEE